MVAFLRSLERLMASAPSRDILLGFIDSIPLTPLSRDKGVTGFIYTRAEMESLAFALECVRVSCLGLPRIWSHYGPHLEKLQRELKEAMEA
jgi:hypothetical protein